jgi:hypothetical protein
VGVNREQEVDGDFPASLKNSSRAAFQPPFAGGASLVIDFLRDSRHNVFGSIPHAGSSPTKRGDELAI